MAADFRAFLLQTDRPLQVLESSGPQIGESMVPLAGRRELVDGPYGSARVRTGLHRSEAVWGVRDRLSRAAQFIGQLGRASKGAGLLAGGRDLRLMACHDILNKLQRFDS